MRQLMAQGIANCFVVPVSIVCVRAEPQLDDFALIAVQSECAGLLRGVHGRVHFGEERDAEFVGAHGGFDAGVVAEALEEAEGAVGIREVGEWAEGLECVLRFFLDLLVVAVSRWGGGFDGSRAPWRRGGGYAGIEGGYCGGRAAHESYLP